MIKRHPKHFIYVATGILILIILYVLKNTNYFIRVSGFIFSVLLFFLFDYLFKMNFKKHHYLIFIFITATGILLSNLYYTYTNYDKVLHLVSPFLICIIIFFMVNKMKTKFSIKLFITAMIMISILALFEIGEYSVDKLFDWKLQGAYLGMDKLNIIMDRNDDTMIDLILGVVGALIFVSTKAIIFFYKKRTLKN